MSNTETVGGGREAAGEETIVQPIDREFNVAVQHLTEKFVTRGYAVLTDEEFRKSDPWAYFLENKRPGVPTATNSSVSAFADVEIEQSWNALAMHFMFTDVGEHAGHAPQICPIMVTNAADAIAKAIVDAYGDDERTQRWRKIVYFLMVGKIAYSLMFDQAANAHELVEGGLRRAAGDTVEITKNTLELMYGIALMTRIAGAENKPTIH